MFEGELGSICEGVELAPVRIYCAHGLDDDAFCHGAGFGTLADLLQPCRVCILGFDEAALRCGSLDDLASLCTQRVLADIEAAPSPPSKPSGRRPSGAQGGGGAAGATGATGAGAGAGAGVDDGGAQAATEHVVLTGYGFGACIAHRVALQFQEVGRPVALVLLDSEASSWLPRARTFGRLGGYTWLGGPIEAALLMCRTFGLAESARRAATALATEVEEFGSLGEAREEEVLMEVFWDLARQCGVSQAYFLRTVHDNGYLLERFRALASDGGDDGAAAAAAAASSASSSRAFDGESLLVVASGDGAASPEFAGAEAENRKLCSRLDVVEVPGTHYTICQRGEAGLRIDLVQAVAEFLLRRGFFGVDAQDRVEAELSRREARAAAATDGAGKTEPLRLASGGLMEFVD